MKKLNITKGDWYVSDFKSGGSRYVASKSEFGDVAKVFGGHGDYGDQADANAQLIAEAGTIYNQAGLTPSELLKQRDELLEALIVCRSQLIAFTSKSDVPEIVDKTIQSITKEQ